MVGMFILEAATTLVRRNLTRVNSNVCLMIIIGFRGLDRKFRQAKQVKSCTKTLIGWLGTKSSA